MQALLSHGATVTHSVWKHARGEFRNHLEWKHHEQELAEREHVVEYPTRRGVAALKQELRDSLAEHEEDNPITNGINYRLRGLAQLLQ